MNKLILTTLGVVIAVGFALGCGSGEDEATSADEGASAPLTRAQFIKQADAICKRVAQERQDAVARWEMENAKASSAGEADLDDLVKEIFVPSVQQEAEELKALLPPAGDEAEVARMVGRLAVASRKLERGGSEALNGSGVEQFAREAGEYGLGACRYP